MWASTFLDVLLVVFMVDLEQNTGQVLGLSCQVRIGFAHDSLVSMKGTHARVGVDFLEAQTSCFYVLSQNLLESTDFSSWKT